MHLKPSGYGRFFKLPIWLLCFDKNMTQTFLFSSNIVEWFLGRITVFRVVLPLLVYIVVQFFIYGSRIRSSHWLGAPRTTYQNQISSHILQSGQKALEAREIKNVSVKKSEWSQLFVVPKRRKPSDRSSKLVRWW